MCAIFGFHQNATTASLSRMATSLLHRGPDGFSEVHPNAQRSWHLGFQRLAILDLAHGQQPFTSPDGRITTLCNGELYNWKQLRQELEQKGHHFKTTCDCEILPAAYLEWGTDLPSKLNGMFALAIHDAKDDSLLLARDRCGQKPLYLTTEDNGPLHFASEIKALKTAGLANKPNPHHLATWLSLRYLPEPHTLFKGIQTLPAAHWMRISKNGHRELQRYWQPSSSPLDDRKPTGQVLNNLDQLTRNSVELALQSDVPVAAYLSAGVDSALLAHYIKDLGGDVSSVSIGFGALSDETPHATALAKSFDIPHNPLQLTPDSLSDLPRVIQQMDRPIGDALILAFDHLASHTSSLGCKVALGGEGPDEHFAGYSFQKAYLTAQKLGPLGRPLAATAIDHLPEPLLNKLANFPANIGKEGRAKTANYLKDFTNLTPFQQATQLHTLFTPSEVHHFLHPDQREQQVTQEILKRKTSNLKTELDRLLASQYTHWLPDWSLIRQDKNAMAHSLEYRAPFLDHRLIDFAFTLSDDQKINRKQDKAIWRQLAERHLPQEVTHRPKQPFYLPLEHPDWRSPLIEMARDTLTSEALEKHHWLNSDAITPLFKSTGFLPLKQLASLLILQLWLNQFDSPS